MRELTSHFSGRLTAAADLGCWMEEIMKEDDYELTPAQVEWASRRKHRLSPSRLKDLIKKQKGRCALSGAEMIFEKEYGNPNINTSGCHPLYAAIDHISPNKGGNTLGT